MIHMYRNPPASQTLATPLVIGAPFTRCLMPAHRCMFIYFIGREATQAAVFFCSTFLARLIQPMKWLASTRRAEAGNILHA